MGQRTKDTSILKASPISAKPGDASGIEPRFFTVGIILLVFALGIFLWAFAAERLTEDRRALLRWLFPLVSGFAAGAIVGSITVRTRGILPGVAATAVGGFGVWLITFVFWLPSDFHITRAVMFRVLYKEEFQQDLKFSITVSEANGNTMQTIKSFPAVGEAVLQIPTTVDSVNVVVSADGYKFDSTTPLKISNNFVAISLIKTYSSNDRSELYDTLNNHVYRLLDKLNDALVQDDPASIKVKLETVLPECEIHRNRLSELLYTVAPEDEIAALEGIAFSNAVEIHLLYLQWKIEPNLRTSLQQRVLGNAASVLEAATVFEDRISNNPEVEETANKREFKWWLSFSKCTAYATRIVFSACDSTNDDNISLNIKSLNEQFQKYPKKWSADRPTSMALFREAISVAHKLGIKTVMGS